MRLALAWTLLLLLLLFLPTGWVGSPPNGAAFASHVLLFGVSTLLWGRAVPSSVGAVLVSMIVLAFATELIQAHPWIRRGSQPGDLVANGIGIGVGWLALRASSRWRRA